MVETSDMKLVDNYHHKVASHCESGSVRNLLNNVGIDITEAMVFGIGSGPAFYYLFFAKGPSGFPLIGVRNPPGQILKNVKKLCNLDIVTRKFRSTEDAIQHANVLIDSNIPVAISVDMFYMKYLPAFLHIHAPFHFVMLVGRDDHSYAVSDPYFEKIGRLGTEDLSAAWETHAPLAKDNFMAYLNGGPSAIDLETAVVKGIRKTCANMILPAGIKHLFPFIGVQGIKMYSKKVTEWPQKYRGVMLREGVLFNAVGFEDQGTGGGGFRLMYGAFLQEVAEMFGSKEIGELADRMIVHGDTWRQISRKFIKVGKRIPQDDDAYEDWYSENKAALSEGLEEIRSKFLERAAFEDRFFRELKTAVSRLR
jgi:hypothetical protein